MLQQIRLAWRRLLKQPGFTAVVVLTVALSIGANTVIFSLVNGILLRPLPYPDSDRLVRVLPKNLYQKGVFLGLRGQLKSFEGLAAFTSDGGLNLVTDGEPQRIIGSRVSAELFSVLNTDAERGRAFRAGEDEPGHDQVVILSHGLWQQNFGGDQNIIGRRINLDGESREVVGVMPAGFAFPSEQTRVWVPLRFDQANWPDLWTLTPLRLVGRLRPGVDTEAAGAELRAKLPQVRAQIPWKLPDDWGENGRLVPLQQFIISDFKPRLLILLAAVLLVLLTASVNVATLLLARAGARRKEIALYMALGSSRWQVVRQLLVESLSLALLGGGLGLLLAGLGLPLLVKVLPADTPRLPDVVVDWRVLGFGLLLSLLTGLAFGLVPALKASRPDLQAVLKEGGQTAGAGLGRRGLASLLVMGEVAVAVVLVVSAVLLVKSFWRLSQADPGFRPEQLLTFRVTPLESRCQEPARCVAFYDQLQERLRAFTGSRDVAAVNELPLSPTSTLIPLVIQDHPTPPGSAPPEAQMFVTTTGYVEAMKIPVLAGRTFDGSDRNGAGAVLINESFARRFWPGQNAVGKRLKPVFPKEWWTVVGVVGDVAQGGLAKEPGLQFYVPYGQFGTQGAMSLVVRTPNDPLAAAGSLRRIVADIDPHVPVSEIKTFDQVLSASVATPRLTTWLLVAFAALALLLGAVGVYGLISYWVARRTREIGIRVALGAQRRDILRLVVWQGLALTLAGLAVGVAAAFAATRVLRALLYQVSPNDPQTFVFVAALIASVTFLASYLPARRAMGVDPLVALRADA